MRAIARRVHETFDVRQRWDQSDGGRDAGDIAIAYDAAFHVHDEATGGDAPPTLEADRPDSALCLCLASRHTAPLRRGARLKIGARTQAAPDEERHRSGVRRLREGRAHRRRWPDAEPRKQRALSRLPD